MGAWVEEEDPASSSMASTSSIVRSSAIIIRFLEIIILAPMNYSHVGPSWRRGEILQKFCYILEFYSSLTNDLIGHLH